MPNNLDHDYAHLHMQLRSNQEQFLQVTSMINAARARLLPVVRLRAARMMRSRTSEGEAVENQNI